MNKEILMVVDVVCNEKGVAKDIIFEAIELALASATKKRNREDIESRVSIDTYSIKTVVNGLKINLKEQKYSLRNILILK